jgi:hypothetical protein
MGLAIFSIVPYLLYAAAWIVVVVFSARMTRHGGKAERFLLIGASLMLFGSLLSPVFTLFNQLIISNLSKAGIDQVSIGSIFGAIGIILTCFSAAGIIMMVLAFYWKFKTRQESATSEQGER